VSDDAVLRWLTAELISHHDLVRIVRGEVAKPTDLHVRSVTRGAACREWQFSSDTKGIAVERHVDYGRAFVTWAAVVRTAKEAAEGLGPLCDAWVAEVKKGGPNSDAARHAAETMHMAFRAALADHGQLELFGESA